MSSVVYQVMLTIPIKQNIMAANAKNARALSEIEITEGYIQSLPKVSASSYLN